MLSLFKNWIQKSWWTMPHFLLLFLQITYFKPLYMNNSKILEESIYSVVVLHCICGLFVIRYILWK